MTEIAHQPSRRRLLGLASLLPLAALPWLGALLPRPASAQMLNPFAGITGVEVFCNSAMLIEPVAHPPFRQVIYRMDALAQSVRAIDSRLPRTEQAARQWIMAHQTQLKGQLAPLAASQADALNLAHYYRIDRLPAIVINARSVVYGLASVADAIARYQAHLQGQLRSRSR